MTDVVFGTCYYSNMIQNTVGNVIKFHCLVICYCIQLCIDNLYGCENTHSFGDDLLISFVWRIRNVIYILLLMI